LHITVGAPPVLRIHGELRNVGNARLMPEDTERIINTLLTDDQREFLKQHGQIDFSYSLPGVSRFRMNAYRQRGTFSLAVRYVPVEIPDLSSLNLPVAITKFTERGQGLVLVTGPTGSGKSTTLAALIDLINRTQRKHIITLEDPIEYLHRHQKSLIDQREIGLDAHSFSDALRAALRQDPDVIMVGEMRDLETIATAITAAETGHLVLATLHTPDAPQTIDRIIDVFPSGQQAQIRVQLASVLVGIISQRLIPKADGSGRVVAAEVLVNTPAVANLIRSEKVHQITSIMQTGRAYGMQTMESQIKELIAQGIIKDQALQQWTSEWIG
jgi:twitching motility protein PilT